MKSKIFILILAISGTALFAAMYPRVNNAEKESMILNVLLALMNQVHFHPQKIDDEFSQKAFDNYLENLDGSKRFLTEQDVNELKKYQLEIDNQISTGSLEFFDLSLDILNKAEDRGEKIYRSLIDQKFDLTKDEKIELDSEKKSFAKDEAELKDYWRKVLKYNIISKVSRKLEEQENAQKDGKESDEPKKSFEEIVKKAQEETKELYDDWFKRLDDFRRSDYFETYLNSFTTLYDPHTSYFNPKEKSDFDMNMGGRLEGIGARLSTTEDGDLVKVVEVVIGGPAWKGKELEADDVITKVTQKGEEGVDILGMRIDDVILMIRGKKGTVVILTVRKKDGTIKDIEIERDEIIFDETFAKSSIIDLDDEIKNIGYIYLPKFYSTFDGGNSCAEDVRKEIEKLNAQNVNGIILDLRFNRGGSLSDAISMSGLFIKDGPIVQVKSRDRKPYVYNDEDKGVSYEGPLIVMVNSVSASASEILAGALQDYKRAVIVGSKSTFGKGTVQRFFDLDRVITGNNDIKPLGQVKLTFQKFYRISGGSNQLKGIIPDIVLPDRFALIPVGEKDNENALPWTEIAPVEYHQNVYTLPDLSALRSKSEARVAQDSAFSLIMENAKRMKKNMDETEYPLTLEAYKAMFDARDKEAEKFKNIMNTDIKGLHVNNLEVDLEKINADEGKTARNKDWLEHLHRDVYLKETVLIMKDMIEMH